MNDDFDDELQDDENRPLLPDYLKRAVTTGLSAVLMTEEGIRSALGDMRSPKEAAAFIVQQTERSRKEVFRAVTDELKGFLLGIDMPGEIRKALTGMKLEVTAQVRFVPTDDGETKIKVETKKPRRKSKPKAKKKASKAAKS